MARKFPELQKKIFLKTATVVTLKFTSPPETECKSKSNILFSSSTNQLNLNHLLGTFATPGHKVKKR